MRSMTSACWGVSRSFSRGVLPFSLPLMMRIRLSRYSSVYFSGSHFALRLSTSCFAIFSSGARMSPVFGKRNSPRSASSSAKRIIVSTSASPMTSSAARCCASRRMILAMPIFPDVADRFADERVGTVRAFAGLQVVRRLEVALVHLVWVDEVQDVHRLRLLQCRGLEIVLGEDDELALLVFVALDQIFPADRLAFGLADALVVHGRFVFGVQQAKLRPVIARRAVQLHRNVHQPERDRAFPHCTSHSIPHR